VRQRARLDEGRPLQRRAARGGGVHALVAPSIGAWTYLYRVDGDRFTPLAKFGGDKVVLGHGTVTVSYENRGRSRHGELRDVYRFEGGRYRLVSRT
jgi:hypothetical protein